MAQERELRKLNRLYDKGKYERCAEYAKDCIREYRKSSWPYDFAIKAYIASIPESEKLSEEYRYLRRALRILERYPDTANPTFILAYQELYSSAEAMKKDWSNENPKQVDRLEPVMEILHNMGAVPIEPNPEELLELSEENKPTLADSLRQALIQHASGLQNIPYNYGGTDSAGLDCSGFTKYVYEQIGVFLPRSSMEQSKVKSIKIVPEESNPGDLIFFGYWSGDQYQVTHVGMVFSNTDGELEVIHSVSNGVRIDGKNESWEKHWKGKALFARDLITYRLQDVTKP